MSCQFKNADFESSGSSEPLTFAFRVQAIPSTQQYRPPRVTTQPMVRGPQTAIVVGPSGEEIYTDKYGRIKVQFHWDRLGKNDENSSCWIRVSQTWAGKTWGAMHIPRVGQEVIVDFLEGDPDRPIVTGCVYNADQMPPYILPDNMTQSGIKSRSTKSGVADNFNELRFEDKKDSEEIYFHAEKDFNRIVENNDTLKVGYDKKDKGDQTIEVYNNQKLTVGGGAGDAADGSQTIDVYKNRTATIQKGDEKLEVQEGKRDVIVTKGDDAHKVSGGRHLVFRPEGPSVHLAKAS
jgi:type VI secretion system secreted protein VgrG